MNDKRVPPGSKFLAHGAAAEVWLVEAPNLAVHQCVLKTIRLNLETLKENYGPRNSKRAIQLWEEFTDVFRSKVAQWKLLAHINVVRVLDLDENLHLRVEYLAHGSAYQIQDVLAGLYYLHTQRSPVVHGCIRMDKLFVDTNGTTKIGEFGLASLLGDFEFFAPSITQAGQVRWMSPELLQTDTDQRLIPTTASDIWALGCTLFEIVSGKIPYSKYKHDLRVRHEIVSKKAPGLPESLLHPDFAAAWTLITSCWEWDHEQRPSVHKLVQYIHLPVGLSLPPTVQESQNMHIYDPGNHGLAKSRGVNNTSSFQNIQPNELGHVGTKEEKHTDSDVAHLIIPDGEMDRSDIDRLIQAFRDGPGRAARLAQCSICENKGRRNSLYATKPSNLMRHLYNHFSIKSYGCSFPGCGQQFTTKEQAVVHVMSKHMIVRDRRIAASHVVPLPEFEDLDDETESLASDILDL